jgi:hypothetical protein
MSVAVTDPKVAIPQALQDVLAKYTINVLKDSAKLRNLLNDRCGEHRQEINVLVNALNEGALNRIANAGDGAREQAIQEFGAHLQKQLGVSSDSAVWASRTWFDLVKGPEAQVITMEMIHAAAKYRVTSAILSLVVVVALVAVVSGVLFFVILPGTGLIAYGLAAFGAYTAIANRVRNLKIARDNERMWDPNALRRLGVRT